MKDDNLRWYYAVTRDLVPAKFLLAKSVPANFSESDTLDDLFTLHRELSKKFKTVFSKILKNEKSGKLEEKSLSYLDLKLEIAKKIMAHCVLCERRCGINRNLYDGLCRVGKDSYVSSYFLHYGEEEPLVPSGTIFYGGCNLRCVYCQNYEISQIYPKSGTVVDGSKLANIQTQLRMMGAKNINHVGGEPTSNIYTIIHSMKKLDVNVPQLWNSNMYMSNEAMELLEDLVDIWLPDLKYGNDLCALRLSGVKNYVNVVTRNISSVCNDPMIIRHLVLPGHFQCCTEKVLKWIKEHCQDTHINIMSQYRPEYKVVDEPEKYKELAVRPEKAYTQAIELAARLALNFQDLSR